MGIKSPIFRNLPFLYQSTFSERHASSGRIIYFNTIKVYSYSFLFNCTMALWQSIIDTHKFAIFISCHIKKVFIKICYILLVLVQLSLVTNVKKILNDVVI